jgi:hypothetical protein
LEAPGQDSPSVGLAPAVDSHWYAEMLGPPFAAVEDVLRARLPERIVRLVMSVGVLRGVALGVLASRVAAVGVIKNTPGVLVALAIAAVRPGRSRLVLLEFIRRPLPRRAWKRALYQARFRLVERPLVRRGMAAGQVLTEMELDAYPALYGISGSRLRLVPWALRAGGEELPEPRMGPELGVLSSGRTSCDWETLFTAAAGCPWPLTVVCAPHDLARINALNRDGRARVSCEVSSEDYRDLLRASGAYALVLREEGSSAGHGRLRAAVDAGVPVVASRVRALEGYVEDGETALLVPPGDPEALRSAIDAVLEDRQLAMQLREGAVEHARRWTYADYFDAVRRFLVPGEATELKRIRT